MNKEVKKVWIDALRSGKYQQGHTRLRIEGWKGGQDQFCCLGVLCDLATNAGVFEWEKIDREYYAIESLSLPPKAVVQWAGMEVSDPILNGQRVSALNDNVGLNFNQIATLIEEGL